jgi:16S rRNA (uracil1498-N3)-methyltransferase
MNLFYASRDNILGDTIHIEGQESIHIAKVLRHKTGDEVYVTDGEGYRYHCIIDTISKRSVSLSVQSTTFIEPGNIAVSVAIGLIKKRDRLEFAAEKITELGAGKIFIYVGDHSEKSSLRLDRIESTVLSAMKQSLRYTLPKVHSYQSIDKLLEKLSNEGAIIVGDETEVTNTVAAIRKQIPERTPCTLIIGPEGGFSERERALFKKHGAYVCSLGRYRLRTETAAIVMTDRFIDTA